MRGSIRKHGTGWQFTVNLGKDPLTGKRKQKSKGGFRTKKECEKAVNELVMQLEKGEFFEVEKMSLQEYLSYWLATYAKANVAPSTYIRYSFSAADIIGYLGNIEVSKLKPAHIQKLYADLSNYKKQSNSTLLKTHRMLHIALKHGVGWQILSTNPCDNVQPPRAEKTDMSIWTVAEANKFLETIKDEIIFMPVTIALQTGMREGEICALKWDNINLSSATLSVKYTLQKINKILILKNPKTKKSIRTLALMKTTIEELKHHKKNQLQNILALGENYNDDNYVCCWEDGRPIDPMYISKRFNKLVRDYKLPIIRFHDLRHTHATLLLQQGVNPKIVSERLGHSTISITLDTYSHVLPNMQKEAVLKLDELFAK